MRLTVIMPVYNEVKTIKDIVERVRSAEPVDKEIIIVDDGSTDGTRDILKTLEDANTKIVLHEKNLGKGGAIRTAFGHITGDIAIIQDADLEYDPAEFKDLIKPIVDGVADVVYGSRLTGGKPQRVYMFWHRVGNSFLTLLANILFNTTLSDMETCYKVMRWSSVKDIRIKSNGFEVEPELTAKILKKRLRVYEMPISYYGRTYAEGKKITALHGFGAILALLRFRIMD